MEILRDEWNHALSGDQNLPSLERLDLPKMDSFFREVSRVNPPNILTVLRYTCRDIVLSDGMVLPKGCFTAVSAYNANHDPEIYEEPELFDPWRFLKLRSREGADTSSAQWKFATANARNNVNFGYGAHVCPGKKYATIVVCVAFDIFVPNSMRLISRHR